VTAARDRKLERQGRLNARLSFDEVEEVAELDSTARHILGQAFETLGLSSRAMHSVMRVARTLADLEGQSINGEHVAEAVQYRPLERREEEVTP
jgi:magnesium chelatase family protein